MATSFKALVATPDVTANPTYLKAEKAFRRLKARVEEEYHLHVSEGRTLEQFSWVGSTEIPEGVSKNKFLDHLLGELRNYFFDSPLELSIDVFYKAEGASSDWISVEVQ